MTLWMCVTDDELELPIIVADTVQELASLVETTPGNIYSSYAKYKKGVRKTSKYRKVVIEEDVWND